LKVPHPLAGDLSGSSDRSLSSAPLGPARSAFAMRFGCRSVFFSES